MINRLKNYSLKKVSIEYKDFKESIPENQGIFLYCDPPYFLKRSNLYGFKGNLHKNFDHESLFQLLDSRDK